MTHGNHQQDALATARLSEDDVVSVVLAQHEEVRRRFADLREAGSTDRDHAFGRLRATLAVHEATEEMVLRPVTEGSPEGLTVARERNEEEARIAGLLAELEHRDASGERLDGTLTELERVVAGHLDAEERVELPHILEHADTAHRERLGRTFRRVERLAPTHAHPAVAGSTDAQYVEAPYAALVDRVRDAFARHRPGDDPR